MSATLSGFRNLLRSEALPDALPKRGHSPQQCAYGLYAEQFSGSAFTAPRVDNLHTWLYRIRPSVVQSAFEPAPLRPYAAMSETLAIPNPLRWSKRTPLSEPTDFIEGLRADCACGNADAQQGVVVYRYAFNRSMGQRYAYDADGELLIVPQQGRLQVRTELGVLEVKPTEIVVIPRGIKFQINGLDEVEAVGYVCENMGEPFELPELGPIGANGLADPADFVSPLASFVDSDEPCELWAKFSGRWWTAQLAHNPLDVVAWQGNCLPYKYDLTRYQVINTVSFDHCDPSIFTVLTSPSGRAGVANCDFVIFPARWTVAEDTFRPPWFHRNIMSEYMGLIHGAYDAKADGFEAGGASLHGRMTPHGPDAATFAKASVAPLEPEYLGNTLAFMFETADVLRVFPESYNASDRQVDYHQVWQGIRKNFNPTSKGQ
ncbi:MAG: homogentisate 1,2-dioxygenase [Formosimonas sp.]